MNIAINRRDYRRESSVVWRSLLQYILANSVAFQSNIEDHNGEIRKKSDI